MKHTLLFCLLLACSGIAATAQTNYLLQDFRTTDPNTEIWGSLGPYSSEYGTAIDRGRINAIWVSPTDSNFILAGADGGGLWKSVD